MAINSPGQVSSDSRSPLERLRRCQLWFLADQEGIRYPEGAKKTLMVELLKACGVDPRKHIPHKVVYGKDENGIPTQEEYPVLEDHASLRNGVDQNAILQKKIEVKEQVEKEKFDETRLDALERQNKLLMEKLEQLTAEPKIADLPFKLTLAQKKKILKDRGVDTKGMSREDVEAALEE